MVDRERTIQPVPSGTDKAVPIEIVPMLEPDLERILLIEEAAHSYPWRRSMFLNELKNPYSHLFVAHELERGDLIGYVCFWIVMDEFYLLNLSLDPEWWGRGVGERLARWSLQYAKVKGARKASLEVRSSNLPARRLYEKIGFKVAAVRPGYYQEPREDGLIMILEEW